MESSGLVGNTLGTCTLALVSTVCIFLEEYESYNSEARFFFFDFFGRVASPDEGDVDGFVGDDCAAASSAFMEDTNESSQPALCFE